jgi:hypothetical protein
MILLFFLWIEPECISNLNVPCWTPDASMDRFGKFHVVWDAGEDFNDWDVYYSKSTDNGWTPAEKVWDAVLSSQETRISTDTLGNPHILWIDYISDVAAKLYYMYHNGIEWIGPINLSDTFSIPNTGSCDIAVDDSSTVHIVWDDSRTGNDDIFYSKNSGNGWTTPLNISNISGRDIFPGIELWKDKIFVVWEDDPGTEEVYIREFNGTQWLAKVNVSLTPDIISRHPAVAVGRDGTPMAAWEESAEMYPYFNKYPWTDTSRVWSQWGIYPDVASDTFDVPHVIASGPPGGDAELRYATLTDSGWVYEVLPIGELWEPTFPVVAIDDSNVIHIVFTAKHLEHADIDVYYMKSEGSGVVFEDLISNDTIISYNGRIYISSEEESSYKVYDLSGKLIRKGRLNKGENYIILNDIPTGFYFLKLDKEKLKKILLIK